MPSSLHKGLTEPVLISRHYLIFKEVFDMCLWLWHYGQPQLLDLDIPIFIMAMTVRSSILKIEVFMKLKYIDIRIDPLLTPSQA